MRLLINLVLFLYPLSVIYSQDLKLITRTYYPTTEEYEVLKSNKNVKNGTYTKNVYKKLSVKGTFKNNQRVGIWEFYDFQSDELEQKYDYDNKKLLYCDPTIQKPYNFFYNDKWMIAKLDSMPYLIGGLADLKLKIFQKIQDYCFQNRTQTLPFAGVTVFSFVVDKNGTAKNHKITISSKSPVEESLLNIVKSYSNNWIPGIYNGEKVESEYNISMYISYDLNGATLEKLKLSFDKPIKK
jgi:hypothetical protein